MDRTFVKICGLRSAELVREATEAGASAVGFMFAPSKRRVSLDEAKVILNELAGDHAPAVGVFVNAATDELLGARESVGLDILQLSGDETPDILASLDDRVWKALRFETGTTLETARRQVAPWFSAANPVELVLIDAAVTGAYGGTGHRADWELVAGLASEFPVLLAGGLNPDNVADAIAEVKPFGVDVSSGVERDGQKDPALIKAFLAAARSNPN